MVADNPMRRLALGGVAVLLAVGLLLAGLFAGRYQAQHDAEALQVSHDALRESRAEIEVLKRQLADINLSTLMDAQAYESLRQTIKTLQDQLAETEEELRFYRQLMAPSEDDRGLRVERLELKPAAFGDEVEYRLMLTQVVERHDWIAGKVEVEFAGLNDGEQRLLSLTDLSPDEDYPLAFRFRYFQAFTGTLSLPDGFEPRQVHVRAKADNSSSPIERSFSWAPQED